MNVQSQLRFQVLIGILKTLPFYHSFSYVFIVSSPYRYSKNPNAGERKAVWRCVSSPYRYSKNWDILREQSHIKKSFKSL